MAYDFDAAVDRRDSGSLKWSRYASRPDVLPMWVADMDFAAPGPVLEAIRARVAHGVFGYEQATHELADAVVAWCAARYEWEIDRSWLVWTPGVVPGLIACAAVAGGAGDLVAVTTPIYPPFLEAPGVARRTLVKVPLAFDGEKYGFDFDGLAASGARMLLLCSPHNPTGRVWTRDELARLAELCCDRDMIVCADEIWSDLVIDPAARHIPLASLDSKIAARTVTLMAPSKTFNIAGLYCSFAVVPDAKLRRAFAAEVNARHTHVNAVGLAAALAAYRECEPWRRELVAYLARNHEAILEAAGRMGGLSMAPAEATYLAWIDCRGANLGDPNERFLKAGVALSDGPAFDAPGWVRLNFGCPRSMLDEALSRMGKVLENG